MVIDCDKLALTYNITLIRYLIKKRLVSKRQKNTVVYNEPEKQQQRVSTSNYSRPWIVAMVQLGMNRSFLTVVLGAMLQLKPVELQSSQDQISESTTSDAHEVELGSGNVSSAQTFNYDCMRLKFDWKTMTTRKFHAYYCYMTYGGGGDNSGQDIARCMEEQGIRVCQSRFFLVFHFLGGGGRSYISRIWEFAIYWIFSMHFQYLRYLQYILNLQFYRKYRKSKIL